MYVIGQVVATKTAIEKGRKCDVVYRQHIHYAPLLSKYGEYIYFYQHKQVSCFHF
jgi:hypothetical protein